MAVSEEAQIYNPLDMTHTQPSMALVMSIGEEAPLNQMPVNKLNRQWQGSALRME